MTVRLSIWHLHYKILFSIEKIVSLKSFSIKIKTYLHQFIVMENANIQEGHLNYVKINVNFFFKSTCFKYILRLFGNEYRVVTLSQLDLTVKETSHRAWNRKNNSNMIKLMSRVIINYRKASLKEIRKQNLNRFM